MREETTSTADRAAAAKEAAADAADLTDAFRLAVGEAVHRLVSITDEERASNTAFERAARTALTFLKAAREAQALGAVQRKEDAENDREQKNPLPTDDQVDEFSAALGRMLARRAGEQKRDAAAVADGASR